MQFTDMHRVFIHLDIHSRHDKQENAPNQLSKPLQKEAWLHKITLLHSKGKILMQISMHLYSIKNPHNKE